MQNQGLGAVAQMGQQMMRPQQPMAPMPHMGLMQQGPGQLQMPPSVVDMNQMLSRHTGLMGRGYG